MALNGLSAWMRTEQNPRETRKAKHWLVRAAMSPRGGEIGCVSGSEYISQIFGGDPSEIAYELDLNTVTDEDLREAQEEIYALTQERLREREFPPRFYVYRGGHLKPHYDIIPVTTDERVAARHSMYAMHHPDPLNKQLGPMYRWRIRRKDVLADMGIFQSGFTESELLVHRGALERAPGGAWHAKTLRRKTW